MVDRVVGIDPGLKGGLVVIDAAGRYIAGMAMPTYGVKKSDGGTRNMVCAESVAAFLRQHEVRRAVVEDVFSRKGEGHVGAFSFGEGKGALRGVLAALGIAVHWVAPATWKNRMGLSIQSRARETDAQRKKRSKDLAIARAQVLFPRVPLLKKDGPAEGALLAAYGLLVKA